MHLGEAFARLGNLSFEEQRSALADQSADLVLRSAAALIIAGRRNLPVDDKVCWLLKAWDSAPLELREYIVQGLGRCASPESISFLKEKLSDPDLRLAATKALATIGDKGILPMCEELVRCGTESECRAALDALMTLGSSDSKAVVEQALRSAPSESCRQWAAFLLALNGIATGESLLETRLSTLHPLRVESDESASPQRLGFEPDYLLTAIALCQVNNRKGLLALQKMVDTLQSNQNVDREHLMGMTFGIVGMPAGTSFDEWKVAIQRWIVERLVERPP